MIALSIALIAAIALCALIVLEFRRVEPVPVAAPKLHVREERDLELEAKIEAALDVPRARFGEIFTSFSVWRSDRDVRLELVAADPWKALNEFTRCIVVRYLWRVLESLCEGAVVIVDAPRQRWTTAIDLRFHDHGLDPLRAPFGGAPQFAKDG